MLYASIILFAIAALIGLTMAVGHFKGRLPAVGSAVAHGLMAASGLVVLIIAVATRGLIGAPRWALVILLIAALGGFTIALGFHARKKALPSGLVVGHLSLAVLGFLLLLAGALGVL